MSWARGSSLMERVIEVVENTVPLQLDRVEVYKGLIQAFEDMDCDTLEECIDDSAAFNKAFYSLHPDYIDEEE